MFSVGDRIPCDGPLTHVEVGRPQCHPRRGRLGTAIRKLKAEQDGEIEVAVSNLATSLSDLGLIDEHRIYLHPVVLDGAPPYFARHCAP